MTIPIILASSSPYRQALLKRLQLTFECISPATDETPQPHESCRDLAERLALEKAKSVAKQHPGALVIGSDQTASVGRQRLVKPGNHANAVAQLKACSGKQVVFYTGLALAHHARGFSQSLTVPFTVHFRTLNERQIDAYLKKEQPYDCAGSFKCEGLGISLFSALEGGDPSALEGLPLIALTDLLAVAGVDVLA